MWNKPKNWWKDFNLQIVKWEKICNLKVIREHAKDETIVELFQ